ncbi:MAG TPA: amino acid adenylation domain-containing protein [Thermoanaerobaculia bacterium]|nr:amino acid adenylation domain-containing protein [Thermoanaerobaculia bacterium]
MLYTSGTTGRPKGVAVSHRSLHNYAQWACRTYFEDGASGGDMPLFTSPAFDLTLTSIVCPLLAGRTVHTFRSDDPDRLLAALFAPDSAVDAVKLTPSHVSILGGLDLPGTPVRTAIVGGEDLTPEHVAILRRLRPEMRIWNEYGPTEATIGCTVARIGEPPITIGRPIDNTEVWVLDAAGEIRPVGVAGELCVAGDGLALGYWNDPELTTAKFVDHPVRPGERLYRTGDRARWLPDGDLLLLGRVDRQVKVRGNRIELGEVEERLRALPGVAAAVVLDRRTADGDICLCAYMVPRGETDAVRLREELAAVLPDFMVPSYFVLLPELPLNANGKVDSRALPEPEEIVRAAAAAYEPPRTDLERAIAGIWREVLGISRIGLEDGFFDLGGHSLKATQLVSRIHRALGVRLPLREVFKSSTLRGVSAAVARARASDSGAWSAIERVPDAEHYDVSHAQRRLWVLQQLEEAPQAYNVVEALRLRGNLDEEALLRAFRGLVARHESLRTTLVRVDGEPKQRVHAEPSFELERLDLIDEAAAREHLTALAERPFDLAEGPLLRLALLRLGPAEWVLGLVLHHVVGDGWSSAVLVRDLTALYRAFAAGQEPDLPPLRIHYRDYSAWQNRLVAEARQHRNYWHARLGGELPVLDLPADFPRPPVKGFAGDVHALRLPPAALAGLQALARAHGASLFMVLLAAVKVLLHRWTGQEDVLVGSPIAGRIHADLEDQIGFYVNTLALRDTVDGRAPFSGLLAAVRHTTLEAYEHQAYPFDRLVEELPLSRDTSRSALFDLLVVLQNTPPARPDLPGLEIEPLAVPARTSKLDLSFHFAEAEDGGLAASLEYSTDLFRRERVVRMGAQLAELLASCMRSPELPVRELDLLPAAERHQLLVELQRPAVAEPPDLMQRFAFRVSVHPARPAVVCGDRTLTYGELDRRAGRLALRLQQAGVRPGDAVGVLLGRCEEGLVALLAVLRAGAAYLPLDPAYPEERLAYMLADSAAPVVVTSLARLALLARLCADRRPVWVDVEDLGSGPGVPAQNLPPMPPLPPDAPGYLVYTSGSTGRPKGVIGTRRCLANLMAWLDRELGRGLRSAQYAALSFDVAVQELLYSAASGGTLHVVEGDVRLDPARLVGFLREREIELLTLPFSALSLLLADPEPVADLKALRHLATSGEQLVMTDPLRRLLAWRPDLRLHNQYGPSETHVVTTHTLAWSGGPLPDLPPIGRPITNCRCHVLEPGGQPAPLGVAGELCLAGVQLAAGYVGDPALTAARFVPDPWSRGERLYRTGDLCRRLPGGELEFLGRIDGQLKVRGHRVEPGEIEHALLGHPAVEEACVAATAGPERELVTYLVSPSPPGAAELRAHLSRSLPAAWVPARFVVVPAFPRTPSGKVDRRALLRSEAAALPSGAAHVPPSTAVEKELAAVWEEVLRRSPVGLDDGFFELGGHSLKAVQMAVEIRRRLDVDVPLIQIFRAPTLRALAAHVEELRTYEGRHLGDAAVLLNAGGPRKVFALPPVLGYGIAFKPLAERLPGQAFYGLDFLDGDGLLERYARVLCDAQPAGPFALFGYSAGGNLAFELARELARQGRQTSDIVLLDSFRLFPRPAATEEEVRAEVQANLDYFGSYIEADPYFAMYVTNPQIRDLLVRKMSGYLRFLREIDNAGTVEADLHLIRSAEPLDDTHRAAWASATTGAFHSYAGHGRHTDMIFGEHLDANAWVLREIFDSIP